MRRLAFLLCLWACTLLTAGAEVHAQTKDKQKPGHLTRLLQTLWPTGPKELAAATTDKNSSDPWRKGINRPAAKPTRSARSKRPWWDWLGITKTRRGSPASVFRKPSQSDQSNRPWWDWLGLTRTTTKTTTSSMSQASLVRKSSRPVQSNRPWWDWLGVTQTKPQTNIRPQASPVRRAPRPDQSKRPWWDWLGVTKK